MTQVNGCLKWLLTVFNLKFAFAGGSIIVYTLKSQFEFDEEDFLVELTPASFYIVGSIVMVIASLGAVGAYNESKGCMVVFLVCMILGSIVMLFGGSSAAVEHSKLSHHEAEYRGYLPLDKASFEMQQEVKEMQKNCCGLFSYEDWGGHIPDSCLCSTLDEMENGNCQTVNDTGVLQQKSIYSETCIPSTIRLELFVYEVVMWITFPLAALGLLGMILSSIMIHQLRQPNRPVFMMSAPAFTRPPKYEELQNVLSVKYY